MSVIPTKYLLFAYLWTTAFAAPHKSDELRSVYISTSVTHTPTTTTTSVVATKTAVKDCHYQGLPTTHIAEFQTGEVLTLPDEISCQTYCQSVSECLSYELWGNSCFLYNVTLFSDPLHDGIPLVIPSLVGGIYWNDRFPEDGSDFCYGDGTNVNSTLKL